MGSILIRGAKLADPEKICCERLDLLCRNGVIEKIEKNIHNYSIFKVFGTIPLFGTF